MPKQQRIRDPLHDLIEFNIDEELEGVLWRVIQTPTFQRLRRIKQLGFSDFVYPGATHSRLLHSVGVFHTARRLMSVIRKYHSYNSKEQYALAGALVHDVGHGPFSHAFEKVGKRFKLKMVAEHASVSDWLIRKGEIGDLLREIGKGFADDVADVVSSTGTPTIYSAVVSSQFDADRLDYMRRDRLMAGTQHAGIDFEWLMANLELAEVEYSVGETRLKPVETFVLGRKAIFAAEAYVLGLFQLYPTVYLHKATRGAEKIFIELIARIITLINNGSLAKTGLPANHPLVKFAKSPDDINNLLGLDDTVIWGALPLMAESGDDCLSELAKRLRDRKLYKCIDVRAEIAHVRNDKDAVSRQADEVCTKMAKEFEECQEEWSKASPEAPPRLLIDEDSRSPYKELTEDKGALNQINIRTDGDHLEDLSNRSSVVAELQTYRIFRVYHAQDDDEAKTKIRDIMNSGISKWPA
jgi:HD superfamily phosphohydrolase